MSRFPFVVRVAAGVVVVASEKGQELLGGAAEAPLVLGSKSAQALIKVQQDIAGLAVRGDEVFDSLFPPKTAERAEWATFDDDADVPVELPPPPTVSAPVSAPVSAASTPSVAPVTPSVTPSPATPSPATTPLAGLTSTAPGPAERTGDTGASESAPPSGRYALYSAPPSGQFRAAGKHEPTPAAEDGPEVVRRLDYPELTLAQLRGRLSGIGSADLTALLAFERAHKARPPFLTMLENRQVK